MNSMKYFMEKMKYFMENIKYFMERMKCSGLNEYFMLDEVWTRGIRSSRTFFKLLGPCEILSRSKIIVTTTRLDSN